MTGEKMETGKPRVGEVVRVMDGSMLHGKKYLVVGCPKDKHGRYHHRDDVWWVIPADESRDPESAGFIKVGVQYEVVSSSGEARTSVVSNDVDAKLERMRDDNLRDQFKYW